MAKATFKMPEEFLKKVSRLGARTDEILPRVLEAGAEIIETKVRSNLIASIGKDTLYESRSTGQLAASLGISAAKVGKDGNHNVKIGFSEPRSDGQSNAKIANILEYGKAGQPPKPFLTPAVKASKNTVGRVMQEKLEQEVASL